MTLVKFNNGNLQKPFASIVDELFNEFPSYGKSLGWEFGNFPPVNIHETTDAFHLELSVPGRSKDDFKISVDNGVLTIGYEKKEETKSEEYKTIRREYSYRSFKRSFNVDQKIDAEKIQAKYENGVLKVLLPKKAEAKESAKQINVD